jgi:Bacterial Ig-like domain/Bacterial Ig domain/Bacterial pre-peptidase C-terminal domain
MIAASRCRLALACVTLLLSACGGDGNSPPDTSAPYVLSTTAGVQLPPAGGEPSVVYLEATANDNVKVTSVKFLIDGKDVLGDTQQNNDGTWLHEMNTFQISAGQHTVTAVAYDAAGNSGEGSTTLIMPPPALATPDTTPPVVTAAVDGSFGLAKLTAIATDDVQVATVLFFVDGQSTGAWGRPSYMGSDPANQFFSIIDTTSLSNGTHQVFVRATDTSGNHTDSTPVTFTVDSAAGLTEAEPNGTSATANLVAAGQTLITGTLTGAAGKPDVDVYKLSLPASKTLVVDMLSTQFQDMQVQLLDANGKVLAGNELMTASEVNTVSYANGGAAQDIYISVTSLTVDFDGSDRYRLTLSLQ